MELWGSVKNKVKEKVEGAKQQYKELIEEQMKKQTKEQEAYIKAQRVKGLKMEYLGGHPKVKAGEVKITQGLETNSIKINGHLINVTKIVWDEKGQRSLGKAAVGAIVGGILTGGLGTIAGAAFGGRKKDNSLAVVTFMEGPVEHTMYFRCDQKEYAKLSALL